jgi:hypothetical protein
VADIFFSYSSQDRERVRRVRDALADKGFDVFWDQQTPAGIDWDTWIRGELTKSKCAVVFWSAASTASDNVRHEATVAKRQGKLISVFIEQLTEVDIPLGLYAQQAANLAKWNGDYADDEWRKFRDAFEAKLTPRWVQEKVGLLDAEVEGERARRKTAEAHEKTLRAQISKEAKIQQGLKEGRDSALAEVVALKDALQAQISKQADTEQGLKTERDRALADVTKLKATVEGLSQAPSDAETRWAKESMKRWLAPIAVGIALLAAVLGGTLVSLWPGKKSDAEAETKIAELTATVIKSDKARQDAEAKGADAEKARQAAEAKIASVTVALAQSEHSRQAAGPRLIRQQPL